MPWLTNYTDANQKVVDEKRIEKDRYPRWTGGPDFTVEIMAADITILQYRYVGMTLAAAESCQTAINDPPDLVAVVRRESAAGSYCVEVTERTQGAYAPEA